MKLNNKGMSLIELIISLVLVSTVVFLMYNLLFKLSDLEQNSGYAIHNQANRAEIIKTVERDLINHEPIDIIYTDDEITFLFENDFKSVLKYYRIDNHDFIEYIPYDGENYKSKWAINGASINYDKSYVCGNGKMLKIVLIINTNDEFNSGLYNNSLDDIQISYVFSDKVNINACN